MTFHHSPSLWQMRQVSILALLVRVVEELLLVNHALSDSSAQLATVFHYIPLVRDLEIAA